MRTYIYVLLLAVGWWGLIGAGCAGDSPELRVDGRNAHAFYAWRAKAARDVSARRWQEFIAAIDQLRLMTMARGVTGREAIDEAVAKLVHGRTINEVMQSADRAELEQLLGRARRLKGVIDGNALLAAAPGETQLAAALDARREGHREQLQQINRALEELKQRAERRGMPLPAFELSGDTPDRLSRESAMRELGTIVQKRRAFGEQMWGDWPAKIGQSAEELDDASAERFVRQRDAAALRGEIAIPVFVRARWRVFEGPVQVPRFSDAIVGNLTAADRAAFAQDWMECTAEIWARREASSETVEQARDAVKENLRTMLLGSE